MCELTGENCLTNCAPCKNPALPACLCLRILTSMTKQHTESKTSLSPSTASLAYWLRCPPQERISSSNPACDGIFPGSSHTSDFKIGTPVATLLGAWRYRVSAGTGWPGVSIL